MIAKPVSKMSRVVGETKKTRVKENNTIKFEIADCMTKLEISLYQIKGQSRENTIELQRGWLHKAS